MKEKIEAALYVVATPIGNLEEITPRALHILANVELIACEDTRQTVTLLTHFGISKPLVSCHEHNEGNTSLKLIEKIKSGSPIALVSDAGYPGISDPGSLVVYEALKADIPVKVVSGPCALINALVGSGLDTTHFYFYGFLPTKNKERKTELTNLAKRQETIIFYESPHRLLETLNHFLTFFGDRHICAARELTKKFEEFKRGTISEVIEHFKSGVKGEFVLIVEGNKNIEEVIISDDTLRNDVNRQIAEGISTRDAIKNTSVKFNVSKSSVYKLFFS